MPKLCEGCGFYSADNAPSECPDCSGTLKFTFLPPAGKAAAPIKGLPTNAVEELDRRKRAAGGSRVNWLLVKGICAALFTVAVAGVRFYLKQEAREEREAQQTASVERVRPGMHISEAARLLEAGSNRSRWHGSTRHDFDEDDDSDGTLEVNGLKVTWRDGYVVSVERGGDGGTRERATRTTTGPEVEADGVADGPDKPVQGAVAHPAERVVAQPGGGR